MRTTIITAGVVLALPATASAGDGGFATGQKVPASRPSSLAVGDFNRDGRPDLAVLAAGTGKVEVRLRTAEGAFTAVPSVDTGLVNPREVVVADFNTDGNDDLAVAAVT